jgi:hypothetical protein
MCEEVRNPRFPLLGFINALRELGPASTFAIHRCPDRIASRTGRKHGIAPGTAKFNDACRDAREHQCGHDRGQQHLYGIGRRL